MLHLLLLGQELLDLGLRFLERDDAARLVIDDLDDVVAELGRDDVADLAGLQLERRPCRTPAPSVPSGSSRGRRPAPRCCPASAAARAWRSRRRPWPASAPSRSRRAPSSSPRRRPSRSTRTRMWLARTDSGLLELVGVLRRRSPSLPRRSAPAALASSSSISLVTLRSTRASLRSAVGGHAAILERLLEGFLGRELRPQLLRSSPGSPRRSTLMPRALLSCDSSV